MRARVVSNPRSTLSLRPRGLFVNIAAVATLTVLSAITWADQATDLERLRMAIHDLKSSLEDDSIKLTRAREQAFELERDSSEAAKRQRHLEHQISIKTARVNELKKKKARIGGLLETSRAYLHQSALSRYMLSLQPKLKILLNTDDARKLSRILAYYNYIIAGHHHDVKRTRSNFEALASTEAALKLEMNSLRNLMHETIKNLELLGKVRVERSELAVAIRARMDYGNTRMDQLREDERRLLDLIGKLGHEKSVTEIQIPFIDLKGKLDWPAPGRVANAPGMALRQGGARWAGVLIKAETGTEVISVAGGRVVFADWFRNLGQLVIIDHGDGYMTLYGNNTELHKQAGEEVGAGEIIATVGDGDDEMPHGLYFELRVGGEPLDPRPWFVAPQ